MSCDESPGLSTLLSSGGGVDVVCVAAAERARASSSEPVSSSELVPSASVLVVSSAECVVSSAEVLTRVDARLVA